MERFVAIDDVCAWPNLTLMPDGEIIATIFNQPCHGKWEGDVECWVSVDGGRLWQRRGVPAPHEPGTNRMNVAAGLAGDHALVVIASGWSSKSPRDEQAPEDQERVLEPWVCRSSDAGRTWSHSETVTKPYGIAALIPFGNIVRTSKGTLGASFYSWDYTGRSSAYLLRSYDDGRTWMDAAVIGADNYNETDLLPLEDGRWLAASRTAGERHLEILVSEDDGSTWQRREAVTLPGQLPGHLLRLADGRVLLTYAVRNQGLYGVAARISENADANWGPPVVLVNFETARDGGYPASVQLPDGTIVTAYYADHTPAHQRYHMGVIRWRVDE